MCILPFGSAINRRGVVFFSPQVLVCLNCELFFLAWVMFSFHLVVLRVIFSFHLLVLWNFLGRTILGLGFVTTCIVPFGSATNRRDVVGLFFQLLVRVIFSCQFLVPQDA